MELVGIYEILTQVSGPIPSELGEAVLYLFMECSLARNDVSH